MLEKIRAQFFGFHPPIAVLTAALFFFIGIAFLTITQTKVLWISENENKTTQSLIEGNSRPNTQHRFEVKLSASYSGNYLFNLAADDELVKVSKEGNEILPEIAYKKGRTSHKDSQYGDLYRIPLKRGENVLNIDTLNKHGRYNFKIAQQRSLFEFIVITLLIVLPATYLGFLGLHKILGTRNRLHNTAAFCSQLPVTVYLLVVAIALRFYYFSQIGSVQFQHDYFGHIEYIKFFAEHFYLPMPHKGWEFPQQPFYYAVNGVLYAISTHMGLSEKLALHTISGVTTLLSCIGLIYAYRLFRILTQNSLIHYIGVGFLAFTPSLVFMGSRINNDPWAFALASIALFYVFAAYRSEFKRFLVPMFVFSSAALLTKISSISVWLVLFIMLMVRYVDAPNATRKAFLAYSLIGISLLSFIFFRAYSSANYEFVMVNSGIWPGQDLRPLDANYFLSFNFFSLLEQAQAFWNDSATVLIKRSFFTYQYGTMLFGEFEYTYWKAQDLHLEILMQLTIVIALIVPIGFIFGAFTKKKFTETLLLVLFCTNFILLLKFMFQFPSSANTDFRYYAPALAPFAYLVAKGLSRLADQHNLIKRLVMVFCSFLFGLQTLFVFTLAN